MGKREGWTISDRSLSTQSKRNGEAAMDTKAER